METNKTGSIFLPLDQSLISKIENIVGRNHGKDAPIASFIRGSLPVTYAQTKFLGSGTTLYKTKFAAINNKNKTVYGLYKRIKCFLTLLQVNDKKHLKKEESGRDTHENDINIGLLYSLPDQEPCP